MLGENQSIFEVSQDVKNLTRERGEDIVKIAPLQNQVNSAKHESGILKAKMKTIQLEEECLSATIRTQKNALEYVESEPTAARDSLLELRPKTPELKSTFEKTVHGKHTVSRSNQTKGHLHLDSLRH
jgi:chromosome segregation ATPase